MDRMYAPWRLAFIKGQETETLPSPTGCIFCDYPIPFGATLDDGPPPKGLSNTRRDRDRARLIVTSREHAFVILNKYPYGNGHVMVVPRTHTHRLEDLSPSAFAAVHELLHETVAAVRAAYEPHGMNIGMNMGRAAGAGIDEHVHYHVVPRWNGDVNFMPVLADTKVINEGLNDTWTRLCATLRRPSDDAA
ncbi:MAG: HIT family protein [Myxococcota bacterium]